LPLVVVRKRPTLTSFHPTPPGLFEPTTGVHQFGGGSRQDVEGVELHLVIVLPGVQPVEIRNAIDIQQHRLAIVDERGSPVPQRGFDDQRIAMGPIGQNRK
jgi:hypothetical protein